MEKISAYEKQALHFCEKYSVHISSKLLGVKKHFNDDKEGRDVYLVTINRENRKPYVFEFGQSLVKSAAYVLEEKQKKSIFANRLSLPELEKLKPTAYDILACLEKSGPMSHEDFCSNYGYDTDSRKGLEVYLKVQQEASEVVRLFGDCMEELQEIA